VRQAMLFGGGFLGTLAVLGIAWLALTGEVSRQTVPPTPAPSSSAPADPATPTVTPSPAPTTTAPGTLVPARTVPPVATQRPTSTVAAPTDTPRPAGTAAPTATQTPSPRPAASGSTRSFSVTLAGRDYDPGSVVMTDVASITPLATGGIILETDRSSPGQLLVSWEVPARRLPAGAVVVRIDVAICGSGEGDFWEIYGPPGSLEVEYEGTQPGPDGCWHFTAARGPETTSQAGVQLGSRLQIDRVIYRFTLR